MKQLLALLFGALLLMTACSKDNPTEPTPPVTDLVTGNIKTKPAFFSIGKKAMVATFDLKFVNEGRTVGVFLNGGVSGSAGVTAKNLGIVDFNATADTTSGFVADADGAFVIGENWYNYDPVNHTLSSKGEVFLIRASNYKIYKMKIDAFDSGYTITYARVGADGAPVAAQTKTIAATTGAPGLFSLFAGATVSADEWDVAFATIPLFIPEMGATIQNPGMRINSAAGVQVATVPATAYESITTVPGGLTFQMDEGDSLAVGDRVFVYNSENHRLTPADVVYIVKTVAGKHAKLQVTSYYDPETGNSGFVNFKTELLD